MNHHLRFMAIFQVQGNMLDSLLGGPRDQFWNVKMQRVKVVRLGEDEDECSVPWPPLGGSREVERPYELT